LGLDEFKTSSYSPRERGSSVVSSDPVEPKKKKKKNSAAEEDLLSGSVSRSTNPSIIHPCLIYLSCWLAFALHRSDANRRLLALCRPERELRACDRDAMPTAALA
jgi:hypothetical protein